MYKSYSPYRVNLPSLRDMDNVRKTLDLAITDQGTNYQAVSLAIGMNKTYIQQFIDRGSPRTLPEKVRQRLAKHMGMTEEQLGKMVDEDEHHTRENDDQDAFTPDEQFRGKIPNSSPEIDAQSGAGLGTVGESRIVQLKQGLTVAGHKVVDEWVIPPNYLRSELKARPGRVLLLEVIGDSMTPTILSGDRIIVDYNHTRPVPDGLFVIDEGDGPLVKRLQLVRRSDPVQIEIISDNANHKAYFQLLDDIKIVGRVVAKITRM